MSLNYYIPFTILILALIFAVIYSLIGEKSNRKSIIAVSISLGSIILLGAMSIFVHPKLEANARYKPDMELKIIWNQADAEYYINYLGRPMKLRDACPEQVGEYIPENRVREIPTVSVYEKTYLPIWGLTLSNNAEHHFVWGQDARIDQTIEME